MEAKKPRRDCTEFWLARTSILWAENQPEEALKAWQEANDRARKFPKAGAYDFERSLFLSLRRQLEPSSGSREPVAIAWHPSPRPLAPEANPSLPAWPLPTAHKPQYSHPASHAPGEAAKLRTGAKYREAVLTSLEIPVNTVQLPNGLRVVVSPDHSAPVVLVGVYYRIGFRLEPEGRSGFAHLFEHMMFQGSEHAGKMMHIRLVNASGGVLNGSTAYDYTNYFEVVPSNALDRMLWLEADRMRALNVTEENLINQRDVVKEEVRVNVLNRPYGGFPWLDLPPVAYRRWPNAHNFYGDFDDLDAAGIEDVRQFFRTYYTPRNAALVITGDVEPKDAFALVGRYFSSIPAGPEPPRADVDEAAPGEERRGVVEEKFGNLGGIAVGYYAPDRLTDDWYAFALADRVLHGGRAGRVYRELVLEQQLAVDTDGGINYASGDLFDYTGPMLMTTRILHRPDVEAAKVLAALDRVTAELCEKGPDADELTQVKAKMKSDYYSALDGGGSIPRFGRMHYLACFSLFDNDPGMINLILDRFSGVSPGRVREAAARYILPNNRAIVERRPVAKGGE